MLKEHPIPFSAPMVRAILSGTKVQTRRIVKPQPAYPEAYEDSRVEVVGNCAHWFLPNATEPANLWYGPYAAGERLWVRETWASPEADKTRPGRIAYNADGVCGCWMGGGEDRHFIYHGRILEAEGYHECFPANGSDTYGLGKYSDVRSGEYPSYRYGWRPSIFMPRWASRITLEITAVRVERVQDITEEDAEAEGVDAERWVKIGGEGGSSYRMGYRRIWDEINSRRGYPWVSNPWVWCISFRRLPC